MRLKCLELSGFKSFVDPTKIEFGEGITAIVGPNGCGKSNIVDALRWVLGEHSARHLRGGVMDDLIFQGSDSRPPVAVCDVELTFSIEPGALSPPYHELDEIRIRRRLTREGGSDAFINGKMVRLKDVVDLFLDTGISTRAYAIVEQGSIARMVTARPEERRVIFEEAAGVMKYRARRRETERRMKDTRQNLERVLDLLDEVRSQCRSLKQQASRAERFTRLQDEFARLQSISLGLRYLQLQQGGREIEQQLATAKAAEAETARALAGAERVVSKVRDGLVSHEVEAQAVQDKLREAERERANLQQQAERLAGERRLLSERKVTLQGRIEDAEQQLRRLADALSRADAHIAEQSDAELLAQQDDASAAVEAATVQFHQAGEQRDALLAEYERLRQGAEQAHRQRQTSASALARLDERDRELAARLDELDEQLSDNSTMATSAAARLDRSAKAQQQAEVLLAQAQDRLDQCRVAREDAAKSFFAGESRLSELKGVVQELRGRTKNLDVPEALRDSWRARGAVWMDEALDVPEGIEAAVAAALRGRSADVRISLNPDPGAWQAALAGVRKAPIALFTGRVGNSVSVETGISLARAMDLKPDHPLYDVFAPVHLVEKITDAAGSDTCSVSRDGWRYEPGGWLVPPAEGHTANRLARQRELRRNEAKLAQAVTALSLADQQFKEAERALEQQQGAWQEAHLARTRADSEVQAAQSRVERLATEGKALHERRERLQADIRAAAAERRHWQSHMDSAAEADQENLEQARAALEQQNDNVRATEQALNMARNQLAQAQQALALFAQARDNIIRERDRLHQEQKRLSGQLEEDSERLGQATRKLEAASDQQQLNAALAGAAEAVDAAHQAMNAIRQTGHALQQQRHDDERAERQARHVHQQASEKRQCIEINLAQETARRQDVEAEISQRCQLSAHDLLQQIGNIDEPGDAGSILNRTRELEERLSRFGPVNLLAIEEFEQAAERETFLGEQAADLEASLSTLGDTISRIDRTTKQRFRDVFDQTNAIFQKTFPHLFGGGRAELRLDSDDILSAGVEVIARPPGKRLQDVTLLSGGEKALTAVALVFSIFQIKPAPFCVLDEVDAPLDDANIARFGELVRELSDQVQFLSITHNKISMQQADRLVGVSMPEPGVSRIVAVDMEAAA